jgi:VTC domain
MQELKNVLNLMQSITLEEMDGVQLMNRVDTKFAFSVDELISFLPELSKTYRILEVQGTRLPYYESLYFDDDKFSFYRDHHNGKTDRYKVRFRNYTESDLSFLEVKHKTKGRTDKKRIKVDSIVEELTQAHKDFIQKVTMSDRVLQPTMWNSFNRLTLVSLELNERLTLDFNLTFKWEEEKIQFNQLVIAELKQEEVDRNTPFYGLMKFFKIRPYRLSKYCIGTIELHKTEGIKYNRFKEKLLKLLSINIKKTDNAA